jgi:hypothetical protein
MLGGGCGGQQIPCKPHLKKQAYEPPKPFPQGAIVHVTFGAFPKLSIINTQNPSANESGSQRSNLKTLWLLQKSL